jgi:hypothetical protein
VGAGGSTGGGCGGAKVCLDFEDQMAGAEPTGMFKVDKTGGATVTVDGSKAFSGTKSVVLKKAGGYPGTFLTFSNIASMIPSNDLHGRCDDVDDEGPRRRPLGRHLGHRQQARRRQRHLHPRAACT